MQKDELQILDSLKKFDMSILDLSLIKSMINISFKYSLSFTFLGNHRIVAQRRGRGTRIRTSKRSLDSSIALSHQLYSGLNTSFIWSLRTITVGKDVFIESVVPAFYGRRVGTAIIALPEVPVRAVVELRDLREVVYVELRRRPARFRFGFFVRGRHLCNKNPRSTVVHMRINFYSIVDVR